MLKSLKLSGVGPAPEMEIEFAPRINVLTGDNGLGKSFLLDVAFWAPGPKVVRPSGLASTESKKGQHRDWLERGASFYEFNFELQEWQTLRKDGREIRQFGGVCTGRWRFLRLGSVSPQSERSAAPGQRK